MSNAECNRDEPSNEDRMVGVDSVVTERTFRAAPDRVWEAITDAEQLSQWLGGEVELDLQDGEGTIRHGEDLIPTVVEVEELVDERRLAIRWASPGDAPSQVRFEIEPDGTGTRLVVTERLLPPGLAMARVGGVQAMAGTR